MTLFEEIPITWRLSSLGELSTSIQYGLNEKASYDDSGILCIRITDINVDGRLNLTDPKYVPGNTPRISEYILEPGDLLIARSGSVGLGYVHMEADSICAYASYLIRFRLDQRLVDPEYIGFFLRSLFYWHYINKVSRGVTVLNINSKQLSRLPVPLPTLLEQREIVKILRQADRLRQLRLEADKQTEMLALATFNAIFGFIDKNVSYRKVKLEKIADLESGVTKGRNLPSHETVNVPYLRVANVQDGYLDLTEIKTIDVLPADVDKYALQPGDVLLTEGGDFDKLGRGAMWEHDIPNCIHQNHVFRVRVDQNTLLPLFFNYYLQTAYARHYFLRSAKRTTNLASINKTQLGTLPVPIPSMPMQEKFVKAVNQIRSILATQENTRADIDQLTRAAMVYAFTGALTQDFREQNQAELIKLAAERDNALKETAQIDKPQMVETAEEFTRALVRNALSRSQQNLLALIESQDAYISTDISEIQGDLLPNEVIRDLELLKQLGLIKAVSIQFTPGRLGKIFFTKTYRPLQPGDNTKETDLVVLREAQEE